MIPHFPRTLQEVRIFMTKPEIIIHTAIMKYVCYISLPRDRCLLRRSAFLSRRSLCSDCIPRRSRRTWCWLDDKWRPRTTARRRTVSRRRPHWRQARRSTVDRWSPGRSGTPVAAGSTAARNSWTGSRPATTSTCSVASEESWRPEGRRSGSCLIDEVNWSLNTNEKHTAEWLKRYRWCCFQSVLLWPIVFVARRKNESNGSTHVTLRTVSKKHKFEIVRMFNRYSVVQIPYPIKNSRLQPSLLNCV